MPCYDFVCEKCSNSVIDAIYPVSDLPDSIPCELCGGDMPRAFTVPFSVHTDEPKWIDKHLNDHVGNRKGPPITTRGQLDSYCRKHRLEQMN